MQDWDVSRVTSMSEVFNMVYNKGIYDNCFIPDISGWDVSQVTNFVGIALICEELNLI